MPNRVGQTAGGSDIGGGDTNPLSKFGRARNNKGMVNEKEDHSYSTRHGALAYSFAAPVRIGTC